MKKLLIIFVPFLVVSILVFVWKPEPAHSKSPEKKVFGSPKGVGFLAAEQVKVAMSHAVVNFR